MLANDSRSQSTHSHYYNVHSSTVLSKSNCHRRQGVNRDNAIVLDDDGDSDESDIIDIFDDDRPLTRASQALPSGKISRYNAPIYNESPPMAHSINAPCDDVRDSVEAPKTTIKNPADTVIEIQGEEVTQAATSPEKMHNKVPGSTDCRAARQEDCLPKAPHPPMAHMYSPITDYLPETCPTSRTEEKQQGIEHASRIVKSTIVPNKEVENLTLTTSQRIAKGTVRPSNAQQVNEQPSKAAEVNTAPKKEAKNPATTFQPAAKVATNSSNTGGGHTLQKSGTLAQRMSSAPLPAVVNKHGRPIGFAALQYAKDDPRHKSFPAGKNKETENPLRKAPLTKGSTNLASPFSTQTVSSSAPRNTSAKHRSRKHPTNTLELSQTTFNVIKSNRKRSLATLGVNDLFIPGQIVSDPAYERKRQRREQKRDAAMSKGNSLTDLQTGGELNQIDANNRVGNDPQELPDVVEFGECDVSESEAAGPVEIHDALSNPPDPTARWKGNGVFEKPDVRDAVGSRSSPTKRVSTAEKPEDSDSQVAKSREVVAVNSTVSPQREMGHLKRPKRSAMKQSFNVKNAGVGKKKKVHFDETAFLSRKAAKERQISLESELQRAEETIIRKLSIGSHGSPPIAIKPAKEGENLLDLKLHRAESATKETSVKSPELKFDSKNAAKESQNSLELGLHRGETAEETSVESFESPLGFDKPAEETQCPLKLDLQHAEPANKASVVSVESPIVSGKPAKERHNPLELELHRAEPAKETSVVSLESLIVPDKQAEERRSPLELELHREDLASIRETSFESPESRPIFKESAVKRQVSLDVELQHAKPAHIREPLPDSELQRAAIAIDNDPSIESQVPVVRHTTAGKGISAATIAAWRAAEDEDRPHTTIYDYTDDSTDDSEDDSTTITECIYEYHVHRREWLIQNPNGEEEAVEQVLGPYHTLTEANTVAAKELRYPIEQGNFLSIPTSAWEFAFRQDRDGMHTQVAEAMGIHIEIEVKRGECTHSKSPPT